MLCEVLASLQVFSTRCRQDLPNKLRLRLKLVAHSALTFDLFLFLQISGCIILGVSIYLKVSKDGNKVRLTVHYLMQMINMKICVKIFFTLTRAFPKNML